MFEHMYNSLLREKTNEKNGHLTSQMSIYSRILLLGHSVVGAIRADCATDPHLGWDRSRAGTFPKRTPVFHLASQKSQKGQRERD